MADFTVEGIIDVDSSKGIASIKKFRSELNGLWADLEKVDKALDKIDGRTVNIDVDVDSEQISQLRADLESIEETKAKIDLDTAAAQAKAEELQQSLNFSENVEIGFESIDDELAAINAEIDSIQDAQIDVDIDRHKALLQSEKLRAEVEAVFEDDITQEINVDVDDAEKTKKDLEGITGAIGGAGGLGSGGLIAALILLAATAGPLGGVLGGLSLSLAGALGVITAGVASFGILSIPVFKDVKEAISLLNTDVSKLTPEKLEEFNKQVKEMKEAHGPLWAAAAAFTGLKESYIQWSNSLRPEIIGIMTNGLESLNTLLQYAGPIANQAAGAFVNLSDKMSEGLKNEDWQNFFTYVENHIGKFLEIWGTAAGNFITGIANMVVGAAPLTNWFNKGLLGMSQDFLTWSQNFSQSQGFKDFVQFVKENGPVVGSIIGGLVTAVINLAKQLAPLGEHTLHAVDAFLDWYNALSDAHPKTAKFVATVAALGIAAAPVVGFLANLVGPMTAIVGVLGGISALGAAVAIFVGIGAALAFLNPNTEKFNGMMSTLHDLWGKLVEVGGKIWQVILDLWGVLKDSGAIENFQEGFTSIFNILQDLLPILIPVAQIIGAVLVAAIIAASFVFKDFLKIIETAIDIIKPVIDWIVGAFQWLFDKLVGHSIIPDLVNGIIDWFGKLPGKLRELINNAKEFVVGKFIDMKDAVIEKVTNLVTGVLGKVEEFKGNVAAKWNAIKEAAGEIWGNLKEAVMTKVGNLITDGLAKIQGFKEDVVTKFQNLKDDAVQKIANLITEAGNKLNEIKSTVTGAFSGAAGWLVQAGKDIVSGLISGITSMIGSLKDKIGELAGIIGDHLPGSPVKEGPLMSLNQGHAGKEIVNMVISGIEQKKPEMYDVMSHLVAPDNDFYANAASGAGAGSVVNNYYNVEAKVPVGTNMAEAGREISQALDAYESTGGRRRK